MVTLIFTFHLRSDQDQVKKVTFWKSTFSFKTYLSCPALSQNFKKMSFVLSYDNYKFQRSSLKKWRHYHYLVCGPLHRKNEDIGLKFCTHAGRTQLYNICSFFGVNKNFDSFDMYFWKNRYFDFWGSKRKISTNRDSQFVESVILHLWCFLVAFAFKILHFRSIWMLAVFRPWRETWRH